jgi:hypothetical protein
MESIALILMVIFIVGLIPVLMGLEDRHKRIIKEKEKLRADEIKAEEKKMRFTLEMAEKGYSQDTLGNWVKIQ